MKSKVRLSTAYILFYFTAILFSLTNCDKKKEKEKEEIYEVTSPFRKDTLISREYVCQIRAIQHIELRALDRGYLQEIYVDEGKFVPKGTLMFKILAIKYKAELEKAEAEANYAEIEYRNSKSLADSNIISPNQLALVKAKFQKAKAELTLAQVYMGFTEIKAPFSGLIDRFQVRKGSLLDEGDLLSTLSDISELWVYFNVPEAEYLDYKKQKNVEGALKVKLRMANQDLYEHEGIVKTIEADFNNMTGSIAFRATFPNPNSLLRHGQTGNVIISVPLKKALLIPQKATFEVLDQKYVYVLDKDNVIKTRRITIGAEMRDIYVVKDGLTDNDKILLEGIRKVRENDKIKFKYLDPKVLLKKLKLHAE